jgi:REP element-mobilizing transposase RayT
VVRAEHPVHVTLRVRREVWNLRARRCVVPILAAVAAAQERFGTRVVHYSIQGNHVHLIVETTSREALARAMKGLCVRIARALHRVMGGEGGTVFDDRYHAVVLDTPTRVRRVLGYVFHNARKHGLYARAPRDFVDPCSSAIAFDGWSQRVTTLDDAPRPVGTAPRTWLLRVGWRRAGGPLDPHDVLGPAPCSRGVRGST